MMKSNKCSKEEESYQESSQSGDPNDLSDSGDGYMDWRKFSIFILINITTVTSSFAVCLFPPFLPKMAEEKGATASVYSFMISINCLVAFVVTPFIGDRLNVIGPRFAFVSGTFIGGTCCALCGGLSYCSPGVQFIVLGLLIRMTQAFGNALLITSTFVYSTNLYRKSVAKMFSLTRTMISLAQLGGPVLGGLLYTLDGWRLPFIVFGVSHALMSIPAFILMEDIEVRKDEGKDKSTAWKILKTPGMWFSFMTFIVATLSNGILSINLEPSILRTLNLSPFYIGVMFGLKDGASSLASLLWGYVSDKKKSKVKWCIVVNSFFAGLAFIVLKPYPTLKTSEALTIVIFGTIIFGASTTGLHINGIADALQESMKSGFADNAATHGIIVGLWSSLCGGGRFVSRSCSGILVDLIGYSNTALFAVVPHFLLSAVIFIFLIYRFMTKKLKGGFEDLSSSYSDEDLESKGLLSDTKKKKFNNSIEKDFQQSFTASFAQ